MSTITINDAFRMLREVSKELETLGENFVPLSDELATRIFVLSSKILTARNAIEECIKDNMENKNVD